MYKHPCTYVHTCTNDNEGHKKSDQCPFTLLHLFSDICVLMICKTEYQLLKSSPSFYLKNLTVVSSLWPGIHIYYLQILIVLKIYIDIIIDSASILSFLNWVYLFKINKYLISSAHTLNSLKIKQRQILPVAFSPNPTTFSK